MTKREVLVLHRQQVDNNMCQTNKCREQPLLLLTEATTPGVAAKTVMTAATKKSFILL